MKVRSIVAVAVLALLTTSCFDDERTLNVFDPTPQIVAAPLKASEAKTMRTAISFVFGDQGGFSLKGRGALDLGRDLSTFSFAMPQEGQGRLSFLYTKTALFVETPEALTRLTDGRPYARVPRTATAAAGAGAFGLADPKGMLWALGGADGGWISQGKKKVGGVDAMHYTVSVDLDAAAAKASADGKQAVQSLSRSLNTKSLMVDVWLTADGTIPRVAVELGKDRERVRAQIDFSDVGERVSIRVPRNRDAKTLKTDAEISNFFTALGA